MMDNYSALSIKVLKGLDAVKKRPGMYIGNTEDGSGLHHMVYEILDNSVDEALGGHCNQIELIMHSDGSISVTDNGRGIPIEMHETENRPTPEVIMTTLHSGGKFDNKAYAVSGGLHGVGISVVNALSSKLILTIYRSGQKYEQEFIQGNPRPFSCDPCTNHTTGTSIRFYPSAEIFKNTQFDPAILKRKFSEIAYLNPGIALSITYPDEQKESFYSSKGLIDYITYLTDKFENFMDPISFQKRDDAGNKIHICLRWSANFYDDNIIGYTNNIHQIDGGTHIAAFKSALTRSVNNYIEKQATVQKTKYTDIAAEDIRTGLTCVLSLYTPDPRFSSQTKDKLVSSSVKPFIENVVYNTMYDFLMENKNISLKIIEKISTSAKFREAAKNARDAQRHSIQTGPIHSLLGKLAFCQEKDPSKKELFLVEGESAGGSAKNARQRAFQAVLPLKGKILNVEKSTITHMLKSAEIVNIITAIGCGIGENCNPDKSNYHKIIIMTDADYDGQHICTLVLTFFYRYMRPLIEAGFIYVAQPPLYSFKSHNKEVYVKDDVQLNDKLIEFICTEASVSVRNNQLSYDEISYLLSKNYLIKEIQDGLKYQFSPKIIEAIGTLPPFYNQSSWWNGLITKLNQGEYQTYKLVNPSVVLHEEQGNFREYNISSLVSSDYYYNIMNAFDAFKPYLGKASVVIGRIKRVFNNIFLAIEFLVNYSKNARSLKRYKGLGEMNVDQLWISTMDPASRRLFKMNIEDAKRAEYMFTLLMGHTVEARRDFIINQAKYVKFQI